MELKAVPRVSVVIPLFGYFDVSHKILAYT